MQRRHLLLGFASMAVLTSCSNSSSSGGVSFLMAKSYLDAAIGAVLAAAQQYLVGTPVPSADNAALVNAIMSDLQRLQATLDATEPGSTWKINAQSALLDLNELTPIVAPYLGTDTIAGVKLAIEVVSAFIAALPPPSNAPTDPPASLKRKAAQYRHA